MPNSTDTAPESEGQDSWPREIVIRPTIDKAIELLGIEYEGPPEGDDALVWKIGFEMSQVAEISSWDDFAIRFEGYEFANIEDQEEYDEYCDLQEHERSESRFSDLCYAPEAQRVGEVDSLKSGDNTGGIIPSSPDTSEKTGIEIIHGKQLIRGKLYDCIVSGKNFDEIESLIPLAAEENTGKLFILGHARQLLENYPEDIKEIIKMSFIEIWNDGLRGTYPKIIDTCACICTIQSDGTLLDGSGLEYFQLVETQVL